MADLPARRGALHALGRASSPRSSSLTRPALERDALLGYQDTAFAVPDRRARCCSRRAARGAARRCSALLVARRPDAARGVGARRPVLPLDVAGEPTPRRRLAARRDGRARAADLGASDLLVTGDPLHSLHGTADLAEAVDRRRDVVDAPYWTAAVLRLHAARAARDRRSRSACSSPGASAAAQAILPLAVVAAMIAVFMVGPIFGLPLIGRYVRTPSVLLTLFYGLAVCGWLLARTTRRARRRGADRDRHRRALDRVPALALRHARRPRAPARPRRAMYERAARRRPARPAVRAAVERCGGRISASDHRPLPHLRYWLGTDPGQRRHRREGASPLADVLLQPRRVPLDAALLPGELPADRAAAGLPPDLPQRRVARARRAGLRHTSSSVTASWSTSRNSV